MGIAHISDPLLYFSSIPEDLLLNIFFRLFDDPRDLPRLVCVCSRFRNLIRNVCYKVRCEQTLPVLVRGLISPSSSSSSSSSEPPGGWASLQKLIVCCPGLWHAGVLLRNWDLAMERGISWLEEEEEEEEGPDLYIQENAGNIHKKSYLREVSNTTGSGAQDNMHVAGSSGKEIHEEEEEEEEEEERTLHGERSTTSGSGFHQQSCGEEDSFHGLMAMEREHIGRLHVIPCHSHHHHHHHHGSDDKEGTAYHHSDASSIKEHAIAIACKVPYHTDSMIVSASNPHRKQAKKNNCESIAYLRNSLGDHSHESSRNPPKSEKCHQESSWNPPKSEGCHPESDRNLEENGDDLRKGSEDLWKSCEYLQIRLGDHNQESSGNPLESEEHHHQESDRNRPESEECRPERSKSDGNLEQNGDDLWKGSEDLWKGNKNHRKNYEHPRKRDKRCCLSRECDRRRRLKHCHMASGCGNLSREQGNKLLANRFRADSLYICDWPGCVHTREKRKYKLFRGVFKNFKSSHVWRNLKDMHAKPTNVGCAFCVCESTWDMVTTFCLKRCIEYHDDGEPVVRAYVCENGHVSGAWTDRPMYNL